MVWTQVWNIIDVDGHILHHSWQNERKNNAEKSSTSLKAFVIACELIVHLFRNCFLFLIHSFICVQNCIFSSLHRITYKKPVTVEQNTLRNPSRISCLVFLPFHHPVFPRYWWWSRTMVNFACFLAKFCFSSAIHHGSRHTYLKEARRRNGLCWIWYRFITIYPFRWFVAGSKKSNRIEIKREK